MMTTTIMLQVYNFYCWKKGLCQRTGDPHGQNNHDHRGGSQNQKSVCVFGGGGSDKISSSL